jgi:hypothetical protein
MKLGILFIITLFLGACTAYNENLVFNSTNDTINVEIYGLKGSSSKDSQVGIYGLRLPKKEKIAFRLNSDTLLVNYRLSVEKIPFSYDTLEIFIYTPSGNESGLFISSILDTLFLKDYSYNSILKSKTVVEIK